VIARRRLLLSLMGTLLLVAGLGVTAAAWVVGSAAGSRHLLQWVLSAAAGDELSVQGIEGNLLDGLRLTDLRFVALDGSTEFTLQRLEFAWQPWQLLQRRLSLDSLRIEGLRWRSQSGASASAEPFDAAVISGWFSALPLNVDLLQAELRDLQFDVDGGTYQLPELRLAAALDARQLSLRELSLLAFAARIEGELVLQQDLGIEGTLDWLREDATSWAGALQVSGSLRELELQHVLRQPFGLQSTGTIATGLAAGEELQFALRHETASLDLSAWGPPALTVVALDLQTTGTPQDIAAELVLQAQYQDFAPLTLSASAAYTQQSVEFLDAQLQSSEVDLRVQGVLDLAARELDLGFELERLDLVRSGVRLADVTGNGSAALAFDGAAVSGQVMVGPLQGQLNEQALVLDTQLQLQDSALQSIALDLDSGDNELHVQGGIQPALELAWTLAAPQLAQVHEALGGQLSGAGQLRGTVDAPLVTGELQGSALSWIQNDLQFVLRQLQLDGQAGTSGSTLNLQLSDLARLREGESTTVIETAAVSLKGSPAAHELDLRLNGFGSSFNLAMSGALQNGNAEWQGRVSQAGVDSPAGNWRVATPFAAAWQTGMLELEQHCWSGSRPTLCLGMTGSVAADSALRINISDLPLAWLNRGAAAADKPAVLQELQTAWGLDLPPGLAVQGGAELAADITGLRSWPPLALQAELRMRDLELQFTPPAEPGADAAADTQRYPVAAEPLRVSRASGLWRAAADLAITQVQAADTSEAEAAFQGTLGADVTLDDEARLGGIVRLAFADLAFLEGLVPGLQQSEGRLQGEAALAGSLSAPELDADVTVTQGAFTLPALGIRVQDFGATLRSSNDALSLRASAVSGEGELVLQASMTRPFAADREFTARLEGSDFALLDTAAGSATISPAVDLRFTGAMLALEGSVDVPEARLDLASVVADVAEGGVDVSRDAVVLQSDPEALVAEQQRALPFDASLELTLGDAVRVTGFGLDAALNGELRLAQEAGRPVLSYGELGIPEGTYRIYNQELAVRDGRLLFYGNPLNPVLDVRAFRETPSAEVGMQISGTLGNIESRPYSTPTLPDNEILAMLVTGKSFNNMNDSDGNALLSAVANFGIERGEGITSMIGNKLGLDSVAINGGDSYLQSSLGLGKYITPDLLMRYEIGIFDRQAVLSIDYSLSERLKLEVRSGISQSVDISYTIEKD
jgi:translocation and assembly module TamB